ncbi:MAG: PadR family transcriptional regulator [Sphingobacteriaceae bacterium]|nr:PadR family transcriptional regulator [Sphingobacteriaceae bacterium]
MSTANSFLKGNLETIVLQLLQGNERMYGYEITQSVKALSDQKIVITEGALYPILHKLEAQGLLQTEQEAVQGRVRIYYRLSEKGATEVVHRFEDLRSQLDAFLKLLQLKPAF